ncbi:hypothetical protein [Roseobacter ponti]|uniref:Uncharacterized protein n=1 Tax=Roseobacter ponti TaxID=1891787 RepID=A0A858SQT0_9RHOB|nr:hypothetical protein [Roseobacter ponti]QJF50730.1 hypothetical protein G3256_05940 [Roseobacter ponti]
MKTFDRFTPTRQLVASDRPCLNKRLTTRFIRAARMLRSCNLSHLISVLLSSILLINSASAREYASAGLESATGLSQIESVMFNFESKVSLELLFGEPVIEAKIRWRIDPSQSQVVIPADDTGEDAFQTVPLYDLGQTAFEKVGLFNVKLQYQFAVPTGETIYLLQDVGAPDVGNGEKWSFNVSGSPNWAEVFYRSPVNSDDEAPTYYSKEESQAFFVQQLELLDVTILTGEVTFRELQQWYAESTPEPQVAALKKAYRTIADGVSEAFGLEIDVEKDLAWDPAYQDPLASGNRIRYFEGYAAHLQKRVEKLSKLPPAFTTQGDPDIYFEALSQANRIVMNAQVSDFESSEFDVGTLTLFNETLQGGGVGSDGDGPHLVKVSTTAPEDGILEVTYMNGDPFTTIAFGNTGNEEFDAAARNLIKYWFAHIGSDGRLSPHFSKEVIRIGDFLVSSSGAVFQGDEVGVHTPGSGAALAQDSNRLIMLDENLSVVWNKKSEFNYLSIGGLHAGWAVAETRFNGNVMISENGEVMDAFDLDEWYLEFWADWSYGYLSVRGEKKERVSYFFLNPDLKKTTRSDRISASLPGGLVSMCTAAKQEVEETFRYMKCLAPARVERLDTGEIIIPPVAPTGGNFRAAIYRDRYIITYFAGDPYELIHAWELNGTAINNIDRDQLKINNDSGTREFLSEE